MDLALDDLVALLARGTDQERSCFSGVWEHTSHDGATRRWRVWRHGRLARVEEPPGTLRLIAGEHSYWRKWPADAAVVELPRTREYDDFELSALTRQDPENYWRRWLTTDPGLVARTLRSTTYQGRAAYRFTAPEAKRRSMTITADAELGIVLHMEANDLGVLASWSEVSTDLPPDDQLFVFNEGDVWAVD